MKLEIGTAKLVGLNDKGDCLIEGLNGVNR